MTSPDLEPVGSPAAAGPGGLDAVGALTPDPVVRLRLAVSYDGAEFCGWARQPQQRSVQEDLESALRRALRIAGETPVRVAAAGRTDAGVHATGQVCHCDVPAAAWEVASATGDGPARLLRRCNGLLAGDLRVRELEVAPPGFDARWSALWRRYRYLVADSAGACDPRSRGHVLWHPRALDCAAMDTAARPFQGEHDFVAYCRARAGASSVRTIHDLRWRRICNPLDARGAPLAAFTIQADAFCHSMVRSLVGAFLAVGEGRWSPSRPGELLDAGVRTSVIPTAPAHALTLEQVGYPDDGRLADQAVRSRRWRGR